VAAGPRSLLGGVKYAAWVLLCSWNARLPSRDTGKAPHAGFSLQTVAPLFRKQGARGGKIGGKRSLETMTPEQRSERARNAVAAREAKRSGRAH